MVFSAHAAVTAPSISGSSADFSLSHDGNPIDPAAVRSTTPEGSLPKTFSSDGMTTPRHFTTTSSHYPHLPALISPRNVHPYADMGSYHPPQLTTSLQESPGYSVKHPYAHLPPVPTVAPMPSAGLAGPNQSSSYSHYEYGTPKWGSEASSPLFYPQNLETLIPSPPRTNSTTLHLASPFSQFNSNGRFNILNPIIYTPDSLPLPGVKGAAGLSDPSKSHTSAPRLTSVEKVRPYSDNTHLDDIESRRPEYLKRTRRGSSPERYVNAEHVIPGLDITVSPLKGRRIQLFQETSEESFEQSLMLGGFAKYGSSSNVDPISTPTMRGRTLEWLQQATPNTPAPLPSSQQQEKDEKELSEKERLTRKRLAVFQALSPSNKLRPSKVRPIEVEGIGRILVGTIRPDSVSPVEESPTRRRNKAKKKRDITVKSTSNAGEGLLRSTSGDDKETHGPGWLDSEFPWSLRAAEHAEITRKERAHRLRTIERYLETEDSDDGECSDTDPSSRMSWDPSSGSHSHGIRIHQNRSPNHHDNADARWHISHLVNRRHPFSGTLLPGTHFAPNEICICHGIDGDQEDLVQCSDRSARYHPPSIGMGNYTELGAGNDPWYCPRCTGGICAVSTAHTVSPRPVHVAEPTFAIDETAPTVKPSLHADSMLTLPEEASPITAWPRLPAPPTTPSRRGGERSSALSSRSTSSTHLGSSASRGGPETPRSQLSVRDVRVLSTPDSNTNSFRFRHYTAPDDEEFDPNATPSRGHRFAEPLDTPKYFWSAHGDGVRWSSSSSSHGERFLRPVFESPAQASPASFMTRLLATGSPVLRSAKKSHPVHD